MTFFQLHKKRVLGLISPVFFIISATVLLRFVAENPEMAEAMARGIAGPTTWPRFMLYAVIVCAVAWLLLDLRLVLHEYRIHQKYPARPDNASAAASSPDADGAQGSDLRIWIGLAIIMAYGYLIPLLGFTIATLLYIAVWMVLGGIRKPIQISLVSVIGTVILLYVFVKLALMPLDRGQGIFGEITLSIYRFLKLF
jgi:putative tricarboxylic transport membrane protein